MDINTLLLLLLIVLAIVAIAGFISYRRRSRLSIKGPLGTGMEMEGSNEVAPQNPAIKTGDIKAGQDARLLDETEKGINTRDIEAARDLEIRASTRPGTYDPKESPPT